MNLPPHKLITTPLQWQECLSALRGEPQLAMDLEANSMYAYRERVCMIQVSTPSQDYLIDPLCPLDLDELGELVQNPDVEKIFHAAEYDLILMKREYGWELNNLFDTMWAARVLGHRRYGLASLLQELFQVTLDKRYQKSNWCKRPLSPDQLLYAQLDTHYLFRLRNNLATRIHAAGKEEETQEIFAQQLQVKINDNSFHPDDFWSIQGAYDLSRQQQAILKAINIYRNQEAKTRNKPAFKILGDRTLLEIAQKTPTHLNHLHKIHGMTSGQVKRYGKQLLQIIGEAREASPPSYPRRTKRPPEAVMGRYDRLHRWRKHRAQRRDVDSDVVVSRETLWELARKNPQTMTDLGQIDSLGPWRRQMYGEEILKVLHKRRRR